MANIQKYNEALSNTRVCVQGESLTVNRLPKITNYVIQIKNCKFTSLVSREKPHSKEAY